jgi:hypothetical protein
MARDPRGAHLEAVGEVGRRGDGSDDGSWLWPAVAAVAGRDSGEEGARLANRRMLGLTCEVGKALGVLAGDERHENWSLFKRRPWQAALAWRAREGALGRPVTTQMPPWYGGSLGRREYGESTGRTGGPHCVLSPWYCVAGGRRVARGEIKAPRGAGVWGRRRCAGLGGEGGAGADVVADGAGAQHCGAGALWLGTVST